MADPIEPSSKFWAYYFGFKICDDSALEPMELLFQKIKDKIWPDVELHPLVRRVKFNASYRNLNLWAAEFDHTHVKELAETFDAFTRKQGEQLAALRIRFSEIHCGRREGKIRVCLKPDFKSQEILRQLRSAVISHFKVFQRPGFEEIHDLDSALLYLTTDKLTFEEVENVVAECNAEFEGFETPLGPFYVCNDYEIFHEYPESSEEPWEETDSGDPEWIRRALLLHHFDHRVNEGLYERFRSLAALIDSDFEDNMLESCGCKLEYYGKSPIVAVFQTAALRDDFFRQLKRYFTKSGNWRLPIAALVEGCSERLIIGIHRATPKAKVNLHWMTRAYCRKKLRNYKPKMDPITLRNFLQERNVPYRAHSFATTNELVNLIDLLAKYGGAEYLSAWWDLEI